MVISTVNEKMTAINDQIRTLSGKTGAMGLDAMATNIRNANTEIAAQAELLEQIATALEGKTTGNSGVVLPELTNPASASDILSDKEAIDDEGNVITGTIATKTSSNLTASGATVTVPAGYYASQATKSVASGSAKTPATTITKTPTISVNSSGLITASVSGTQNITPTVSAGYVSSGTAGTITVNGSTTKQLTTQAAKTITPSTSSQTAVASGRYTTGAITVAAIPSNYEDVGTETSEYASLNAELEEVINSLPEAGGGTGGGVETCTITLDVADDMGQGGKMYYVNGDGEVITNTIDAWSSFQGTIEAQKGFIIFTGLVSSQFSNYLTISGDISQLGSGANFIIQGDGSISF